MRFIKSVNWGPTFAGPPSSTFRTAIPNATASIKHAQKLNALRHCSIVLQYHHSEVITVRKQKVMALISDLYEGQPLAQWNARYRNKRLRPYLAFHVLYNLICGLEAIHAVGSYHADVHTENILIQPMGVRFNLKLIDFYDWGRPAAFKRRQDIGDAIRVFYNCLGGAKHYAKLPANAKYICAGLRDSLILKRFPTMTALRQHLESFEWSSMI